MPDDIIIDKEFAELCGPLTQDQKEGLEALLLAEGCRDQLILWGDILVDGHNRYELCQAHKLPFKVKRVRFADRQEAINWIIDNQRGRRNITAAYDTYLLGKRYHAAKKDDSENLQKGRESPDGKHLPSGPTAGKMASAVGVSARTVRNAAEYSDAVDAIAENAPALRDAILSGEVKSTKQDVAELAEESPEVQEEVAEAVASGEAKSIKDAVKKKKPPKKPKPKLTGKALIASQFAEMLKANSKLMQSFDDMNEVKKNKACYDQAYRGMRIVQSAINDWKDAK